MTQQKHDPMPTPQAQPIDGSSCRVEKPKLVLFDFDGTITRKDTLIEFVKFYRGTTQYLLGMAMLAPIMALFALKIIPNWRAKQFFLSHFFKGESARDFNQRCLEFSRTVLPGLIREKALRAIEAYQKENAVIAVVSASAENWVRPWCDQTGIHCLATRLETTGEIITGRLLGKNCHGDEKACRIKEYFNLDDYAEILAYGDTSGDREMLALAHKGFYKPFRE